MQTYLFILLVDGETVRYACRARSLSSARSHVAIKFGDGVEILQQILLDPTLL